MTDVISRIRLRYPSRWFMTSAIALVGCLSAAYLVSDVAPMTVIAQQRGALSGLARLSAP